MKKVIYIGLAALMVFVIGACDGEKSVKIGEQIWMAKNLNDPSKGGKCYEDKPENCEKYGRLYTWDEAMKACPESWHLPNNAEWEALVAFAGGENAAGGKLKAKNGWGGSGGSDEYGFSALPGGFGASDGSFINFGSYGSWWSATDEDEDGIVYYWDIGGGSSEMNRNFNNKSYLFSVRCVKGSTSTPNNAGKAAAIGGVYKFGEDVEKGPVGSVMIYPLEGNAALFFLDLSRGAPSYNSGRLEGRMTIKDNFGTYEEINEYNNCILKFKFASQQLEITTEDRHSNCGFGGNVNADNIYKLIDKSIPQYYLSVEDEKIFFKDLKTGKQQ